MNYLQNKLKAPKSLQVPTYLPKAQPPNLPKRKSS
jgi:hypothetical protein